MKKAFSFTQHRCRVMYVLPGSNGNDQRNRKFVVQQVPDLPQALVERHEQYQNVRSQFFRLGHTGRGYIFLPVSVMWNRFTMCLFQVHTAANLRLHKEPVPNAQACPDPARGGFLFGRDKGGDEIVQYYWLDAATGRVVLLTDGQSRQRPARWNKRGNRITYANYRRNGRDLDFYMRRITI